MLHLCTAADAELWTTGSNDSCQLGHKGHDNQLSPSRVEALDAHGVCQVACGHQHMLAVADGGALCAWGAADSGQLGQVPSCCLPSLLQSIQAHAKGQFTKTSAGRVLLGSKIYTPMMCAVLQRLRLC